MRKVSVLGMTTLLLFGSACADYSERADVQAYIDELVEQHDFEREELVALIEDAERQQRILELIARPAERTLKWHEYRDIFIEEDRINQGLTFWGENQTALDAAHRQYGVPPEYVVAIIGAETRYGRITGRFRVLDALTTLAFDYPPRSKFFRSELTELLLLAREENINPRSLKGSYAGAMGYGQFIPSSFRAYAVDFDTDGQRDIWENTTDAIGSVANYFSRHGWQSGGDVVLRASVSGEDADPLANKSLSLNHSVGELASLGVRVGENQTVSADTKAALFRMETEDGAEYWVGLKNFYVITRYNHSRLYAMAVHQLSQAILERREGVGGSNDAGSDPNAAPAA